MNTTKQLKKLRVIAMGCVSSTRKFCVDVAQLVTAIDNKRFLSGANMECSAVAPPLTAADRFTGTETQHMH